MTWKPAATAIAWKKATTKRKKKRKWASPAGAWEARWAAGLPHFLPREPPRLRPVAAAELPSGAHPRRPRASGLHPRKRRRRRHAARRRRVALAAVAASAAQSVANHAARRRRAGAVASASQVFLRQMLPRPFGRG